VFAVPRGLATLANSTDGEGAGEDDSNGFSSMAPIGGKDVGSGSGAAEVPPNSIWEDESLVFMRRRCERECRMRVVAFGRPAAVELAPLLAPLPRADRRPDGGSSLLYG
jgi:hypothetical protein